MVIPIPIEVKCNTKAPNLVLMEEWKKHDISHRHLHCRASFLIKFISCVRLPSSSTFSSHVMIGSHTLFSLLLVQPTFTFSCTPSKVFNTQIQHDIFISGCHSCTTHHFSNAHLFSFFYMLFSASKIQYNASEQQR